MQQFKSFWQNRTVWIGLAGVLVVGLSVTLFTTRSGPPQGGAMPQFVLVAPHDGATVSPDRRFVWRRMARSTAYHFFLYEVNHELVWSALVKDTTLVVPTSAELETGRAYLWRVEAIMPGETTMDSELRAFTLSQ